jgi:hypothetical protein
LQINTRNALHTLHLFFLLAIFFFMPVAACTKNKDTNAGASMPNDADRVTIEETGEKLAKEQARQIAESLDLKQLAAQAIISGIDGTGQLSPDMRALLEEYPVGGIILFRYNLDSSREEIQGLCQEASALIAKEGIAPFIAADHEGGLVNRFGPGAAALPPPYSYWSLPNPAAGKRRLRKLKMTVFAPAWKFPVWEST